MILACESCNTRFNLDERLLKPSGSKVRCSRCKHVFVAYPEAASPEAPSAPPSRDAVDAPEEGPVSEEIAQARGVSDKTVQEARRFSEDSGDSGETGGVDDTFGLTLETTDAPEPEMPEDLAVEDGGQEDYGQVDDFDLPGSIQFDMADPQDEPGAAADGEENQEPAFDEIELDLDEIELDLADLDEDETGSLSGGGTVDEPGTENAPAEDLDGLTIEFELDDDDSLPEPEQAQPAAEKAGGEEISFDFEGIDFDTLPADMTAEDAQDAAPEDEEDFGGLELDFGDDAKNGAAGSRVDLKVDGEDAPVEQAPPEEPAESAIPEGTLDLDAGLSGEPSGAGDKFPEPDWEESMDGDRSRDSGASPAAAAAVPGVFTDLGEVDPEKEQEPEEEETKGLRPQKEKKKVSLPLVLLLVVVLMGAGAYVGYTFLGGQLADLNIPFIGDYLKPEVRDPAGNLRIDFYDLDSKFVENEAVGKLFVITGKIKNEYPQPRAFIRVTGKLFDASKKLVKTETVYCGNILTDLELKTKDAAAIHKRLNSRFGTRRNNVKVLSGTELPFMIVFSELPANPAEFSIEVAGSTPVGK